VLGSGERIHRMGHMTMPAGAEYTSLKAVVTRADGTVEDLGVIAYNNKNPLKVAKWEKETFGKISEDTAVRCAKYVTPYAAGAALGLVGIAFAVRKFM
jgi:hypothetical protein